MTVETVLQGVLMEIGLDLPDAQIGGDSFEMRQLRGMMNAAGVDIASRAEWSRLYTDWTIGGGVSSVALPDDFHQMAEQGAVRIDKAGFRPVRAVVAPEQWDFLTRRPSTQPYYHLRSGQLHFAPALPSEGALVRYVSTNWVDGGDHITQNGDSLLIPERLVEKGAIWRWKRQKGQPYDDNLAEFEADLIAEIKADRGEA
ncbi:phage adaptor protein [Leisingera sp. NJS204]|uniref:phage adaptor protein n=1 Tax=Leisingera sp. NJS204 TaxID=2508307 RepID=UPI0010106596|nr:hypothetical protein [Leisingera sp. NJS204]QAX31312.1 hypothetical protein ETW24_19080 [Leisingera sp. NJS204]